MLRKIFLTSDRITLKYGKKFVKVELGRVLISGYAKFNLVNSSSNHQNAKCLADLFNYNKTN